MEAVSITISASVTLPIIINIRNHTIVNKYNILSMFFGFVSGLSAMFVSWQHNSQCEVYCNGSIYWGYWFALGFSMFLVVFLAVFFLLMLVNYVKNT